MLDSTAQRLCIPVVYMAYIGANIRWVNPVVGSEASAQLGHVTETAVRAPTA